MRELWIGLALAALVQPAAAQNSGSRKAADPNEVVCEKIIMVGSRLATKRICATRSEWAEKRKQDRDAIDQAQRAANGPCQTINTHTGAPAC